ncbi:hypothetical protein CfE428DRAFT_0739 [Chthoniobacter flavus Ellin428]|uniref:Uncharacterized protein n=1 Tax=Chthoniobacter flavus Ellin428 TaxID=497964 RepID=B4CVQ2_9BACT|nr:DUF4034 domain-containing protein [Chthoniobacter flavus]EDY21494.1 hypothetical protein CfE428DRAFT_0739 [Chthoniobacter flavus Ellin428]TCO95445.1 uncharacterized protein DUF4034 [Chthoniobacter flavus]
MFSRQRCLNWLSAFVLSASLFLVSDGQKCAAQDNGAPVVDRPEEEIKSFRLKVVNLFKASDFRGLEDMVAEVRSGPPLFATGNTRLYRFYTVMEPGSKEGEDVWQRDEAAYQAWEKAFPKSITARIAHANFLTSYAWKARGSDWGSNVTDEGWKVFGQRLDAAEKILAEAREMQPRCPMWWYVEMTVALGQGWSRSQEARLFAEAKKFFPQFYGYDMAHAHYLLPRWYGEEGDWEKSAEEEAQKPEGLGAEGYARVVGSLTGYYGNIFRESHASWPKTREGYEQICKKYPDSLSSRAVFFRMACLAGDRGLAQQTPQGTERLCGAGHVARLIRVFQELGAHRRTSRRRITFQASISGTAVTSRSARSDNARRGVTYSERFVGRRSSPPRADE